MSKNLEGLQILEHVKCHFTVCDMKGPVWRKSTRIFQVELLE